MSDEKLIPVEALRKRVIILPLRDIVVYPNVIIPLLIGRESSIKALESANASSEDSQSILLVTQKHDKEKIDSLDDLYPVGTLAHILPPFNLSADGTATVIVEGQQRCNFSELKEEEGGYLTAEVIPLLSLPVTKIQKKRITIFVLTLIEQFEQYIELQGKNIPSAIIKLLRELNDPEQLGDMIAMHIKLSTQDKQKLLGQLDLKKRLQRLSLLLEKELDLLKAKNEVRQKLKGQIEKAHREFYLKEQIEALKSELALSHGSAEKDSNNLAERIKKVKMPKEAHEKALSELSKFEAMPPSAAEATVIRNYLETLLDLPWHKQSKIRYNLKTAEEILEKRHYGLHKVKERILEFLAVQKRVKKIKGPILLLVGPPGAGKTSLGKSIAEATGREFIRISLGGVRDEAEIRGHRRTYIGSMPGQILQKMAKGKVINPLFMLDEIDKMAMDFRGDPASALLEVLDPEQNSTFTDHYLEVPYDLSKVLFIATANTLDIPPPLLDRMEVIRVSGYTEHEKRMIATQHLIPKQKQSHGLAANELTLDEEAVTEIIRYYTLEAGVRNLERALAKICRKVVYLTDQSKKQATTITTQNLEQYLGVKYFRHGLANAMDQVGEVNGLAWTAARGELLKIESAVMPGKGKISYTGKLGDVMKESIQTAFNVVRIRAKELGLPDNFYEKADVHIHVPEGATPKDGPSAGIGMCTALFSSLMNQPVRADVAMTGEITLLGKVLPIGGLKEKLLAAQQGGIRLVIIPEENKRDLTEIPQNILSGLDIRPVRSIDEVLALAFRTPLSAHTSSKVQNIDATGIN
jgi:ATP-dependent Lon protease